MPRLEQIKANTDVRSEEVVFIETRFACGLNSTEDNGFHRPSSATCATPIPAWARRETRGRTLPSARGQLMRQMRHPRRTMHITPLKTQSQRTTPLITSSLL